MLPWALVVVFLWTSSGPGLWDRAALLLSVMLIPGLVLLLAHPPHYHYRHNLFVEPFVLMVCILAVAQGIALVARAWRMWLGIAAVTLVLAWYAYCLYGYYGREKENWRDAVTYVAEHSRSGDVIIPGIFFAADAFAYYQPGWPPYVRIFPRRLNQHSFVEAMREVGEGERVWYVTAFPQRLPEWLNELLSARFELNKVFEAESPVYVYLSREGNH